MFCCLLACATVAASAPQLNSNTLTSTSGYFQLNWKNETASTDQFELQQAEDHAFSHPTTLYQGSDHATVISGLSNGNYFYRLRQQPDGEWSNVIEVQVAHHSLVRAVSFFALGAAMFLLLVVVLIQGTRRQK